MRPTYSVEQILGSRSRVLVLRLLHYVNVPLNASQVAARSGLSQPAAASALEQLGGMGLVASSPAGRAWVHWLVRDNVYAEQIVSSVFEGEMEIVGELLSDLTMAFSGHAASVVLYGSYARGDQNAQSDIDVALVASSGEDKSELDALVAERSSMFVRRWGAPISALVYDIEEAAALESRAPALFQALEREGVVVSGLPIDQWGNRGAKE
jgi:predicted nucleotidyltransferase